MLSTLFWFIIKVKVTRCVNHARRENLLTEVGWRSWYLNAEDKKFLIVESVFGQLVDLRINDKVCDKHFCSNT